MSFVIKPNKIVTGNTQGDILTDHAIVVENSRISRIIPIQEPSKSYAENILDAKECIAVPGFVQAHIHLCQTLFRGLADDLSLLDWLQKKIFPMEAAHNDCSMYNSAMVGVAELIRSGTTTILDMGSINHEEEIIRAVGESGMRAFVGKAMMDMNDAYPRLKESTKESLTSTRKLAEQWHNSYDGRVKYAVAPRFVLSCTDKLLIESYEMASSFDGMLFHTHASENKLEIEAVRKRCKKENIEFLESIGVLSEKSCLAHCIHIDENEIDILRRRHANVVHCPSSNLKLGSGIANIPYLQQKGVNIALGADGAPCNNNLSIFQEMRLASLLHKPTHGPTAMPAKTAFEMATLAGARALGLEKEIGSIEVGKKADIVLLNFEQLWNPLTNHNDDIYSSIVYASTPENVDSVMIDGTWVYRKKEFVKLNVEKILAEAKRELKLLLDRME